MNSPHQVTKDFERALCEYTGAPFAVAVNSCTMALLLAVAWFNRQDDHRSGPMSSKYADRPPVNIPRFTYVGVPQAIIHAGARPVFRDEDWIGMYRLWPLPVWDSARLLTSGMYRVGQMQCLSFHFAKTLGDTQGGAILLDDYEAYEWLKKARFDGRTEGVPPKMDTFTQIGWHCYLSPDVSARLLAHLSVLPKHNEPLPNDDYPDLSQMEVFR